MNERAEMEQPFVSTHERESTAYTKATATWGDLQYILMIVSLNKNATARIGELFLAYGRHKYTQGFAQAELEAEEQS